MAAEAGGKTPRKKRIRAAPEPRGLTARKMLASARRFDAGKVKADQVARTGGAPDQGGD